MKTILEIPQTPRMAFDALSGKRPELLLNATRGSIGTMIVRMCGADATMPKCDVIVSHIGDVGTGDLVCIGGLN